MQINTDYVRLYSLSPVIDFTLKARPVYSMTNTVVPLDLLLYLEVGLESP